MKVFRSVFVLTALWATTVLSFSQSKTDSLALVNATWSTKTLKKGLVVKTCQFKNLYGGPQNISMIVFNPSLNSRLKTGIQPLRGVGLTSKVGKQIKAKAAINGSYFNVKDHYSVCYVMKDGVVLDTTEMKEFKTRVTGAVEINNNKMAIIPWNKQTEDGYKQMSDHVLASGPMLLSDGIVCCFDALSEKFVNTKHPRSAVAVKADGTILFVVADGRSKGNADGVSIPELAHICRVLGADEALNLDGGGSSTLWSKYFPENGIINKPSDNKKFDHEGEREVVNFIYIK